MCFFLCVHNSNVAVFCPMSQEALLDEVSSLQIQSQKLLRRLHEYNDAVAHVEQHQHGDGANGAMPHTMNAAARGKLANFTTLMRNLIEAYARIVGPDRRTARVERVASMLPSSIDVLELQQLLREGGIGGSSVAEAVVRRICLGFCVLFVFVYLRIVVFFVNSPCLIWMIWCITTTCWCRLSRRRICRRL